MAERFGSGPTSVAGSNDHLDQTIACGVERLITPQDPSYVEEAARGKIAKIGASGIVWSKFGAVPIARLRFHATKTLCRRRPPLTFSESMSRDCEQIAGLYERHARSLDVDRSATV